VYLSITIAKYDIKGEISLGKRVKYQIGDIFTFELERGLKAVGRVIKKSNTTVFIVVYQVDPFENNNNFDFRCLAEEKPLTMMWSYDTALKNGMWKIIGNIPVEEDFDMPYFRTDDGTGRYYLIKGGDTHEGIGEFVEVTKEEAQKVYSYGIGNEIALPKECIYRLQLLNMI
jgi:hypothetical protein